MVNGVLYADRPGLDAPWSAPRCGPPGELLWMHSEREGAARRRSGARASSQDAASLYWTDGGSDRRVLLCNSGYQLVALEC